MGNFKKKIKATVGEKNFQSLSRVYRSFKPKQKSEKPIAFAIGFSKWKHDHTRLYLKDYQVEFVPDNLSVNKTIREVEKFKDKVFVVWGYKEPVRLKKYAEQKRIPFFRMEDGFIRSVQLGAEKSFPLSMCIDSKALYYDATEESDLEIILNEFDFNSDPRLLERARHGIELIKEMNISKYNNVNEKDVESIYGPKLKKRVLVVGQVEDDQSIKRGCEVTMNNNDLVWIAKMENPDAEIIYKPHPDVLFGKREMQSNPDDVVGIASVIREPLSLTDAFNTIDHVYTITSLSGFEALLRGIPVTTMGSPFYSGWGLTDDRQVNTRRTRVLTIEEVFAAAYILYPTYINPFTKKIIQLEEALDIMGNLKKFNEASKGDGSSIHRYILGIDENQKSIFTALFPDDHIVFISLNESNQDFRKRVKIGKKSNHFLYVSEDYMDNKLVAVANDEGINVEVISDMFTHLLTSENKVAGKKTFSIMIDNCSEESHQLLDLLNEFNFKDDKELMKQSSELLEHYLKSGVSITNVSNGLEESYEIDDSNATKILVLGMNESVKKNLMTNKDLIWMAKSENPDAQIIFKPHPEELIGNPHIISKYNMLSSVIVLEDPTNLSAIMGSVDHIYTLDSMGGLEGILRNKKVTTFGNPVYAGWGLTDDRGLVEGRNRKLSPTELFAGIFVKHTIYINPFTKKICSFTEAINLLKSLNDTQVNEFFRENHDSDEENIEDLSETEVESLDNVTNVKEELNKVKLEDKIIGVFSKGIKDIPNLSSLLPGSNLEFKPSKNKDALDFVVGWGLKPSAKKAIEFSNANGIPYIGLEDGFLRSEGLGVNGSPALSLCVDDVGIYYDATRPSRLENILNQDGWETHDILTSAKEAMELIRQNYLSKYNHAPMLKDGVFQENGRERVLVVDQTFGDMSISLGLAEQQSFIEMYKKAVKDNPEADIYVKTHPDVISGKKQGNISPEDVADGTIFLSEDCNPISLLEKVDKVYVVTSQFGFEALMLGKEVHCYGMPFYAGWGLTHDKLNNDRRNKKRSLVEMFAAAYMIYPNYLDPVNGGPGTIFDVINFLINQKKRKQTLVTQAN